MRRNGRAPPFVAWFPVVTALLCILPAHGQHAEHVLDDSRKFVSRPDLEAPTWNITVFDQARISPGYWFVEPYDYLDQSTRTGGNWTAPMIFDGNGGLIWSGAYLSQQYNSFDFRVSNVLGEDLITYLYPRNRSLVVLDSQFKIRKQLLVSSRERELDNMHDLNFVDDGTRALFFYDQTKNATMDQSQALGLSSDNCLIRDNGFREIDLLDDWKVVYDWASSDHIKLTESTFTDQSLEKRCMNTRKGWDWIHANSIDKFPDGKSFLMSGRHCNTIYKIEQLGHIAWRLGGAESDFTADFEFKRQHHARILSSNATHTLISFFDNASAEDKESGAAKWSRGLLAILQTDTMTASLKAEYGHPDGPGSFTLGRGSIQVLPGGNVFSGWVNGCLQSEHSEDGTLLMVARVKQEWLKSYRSYKFPFVGRPAAPPDVYAMTRSGETGLRTKAYVSWNGATEVSSWSLYKTTQNAKLASRRPLINVQRTGFETEVEIDGYASYIVLEGVDSSGRVLGRSVVTTVEADSDIPEGVIEEEKAWLQRTSSSGKDFEELAEEPGNGSSNSIVASNGSMAGLAACVILLVICFLGYRFWRRRSRRWIAVHSGDQSYEMVGMDEGAFELEDDDDVDYVDKPLRSPTS